VKLSAQQVQGSSWDPDSIMEYEFKPGLIDEPDQYDQNGLYPPGTLSAADKAWALKWYPGSTSQPAAIRVGGRRPRGRSTNRFRNPAARVAKVHHCNECFRHVARSFRRYRWAAARYLAADNDSGENRNATITYKLFSGRAYRVRLRLYYPRQSRTTSLMYS